ncbi:MAG: trigger factor [Nitrospiraceae bacterium]|nr:MAG: trigger factor [Nitrospiraceae bacterium]
MHPNVEELTATKRRLNITIPEDIIKAETKTIYDKIRVTTKIPGFRPGKAPQSILEKRFGKNVEAEVIEKIVPQYYMSAIKEAKLEPVTYPSIEEQIELKPGEPLSFSVTVEVKPDMGEIDYEGISLKKKNYSVEDDEIDRSLTMLQENKALYSVSEDPLQEGDMSILDSNAFIDDKLEDTLTYKEYPLLIGSEEMPKDFSDALMGKKKGDTVEVKISFESDHPNKSIAGKEVIFKIEIKETKKKNLPPIDDELAKEAQCETLAELKEKIRENLDKRKESQINLEYKKEILDELLKRHNFDVPDSMVNGEIDSLIQQEKENAGRTGSAVKPDEELRAEFAEKARSNVKSVILLEAIGKNNKIEVSDADTKSAIEEIAARNNLNVEEVTKLYAVREGSMDALKSRLFADKVLDHILEKAKIEE